MYYSLFHQWENIPDIHNVRRRGLFWFMVFSGSSHDKLAEGRNDLMGGDNRKAAQFMAVEGERETKKWRQREEPHIEGGKEGERGRELLKFR